MAEEEKKVKKLYRSRQDRYLGGVAGGLAEYFNLDANLVRILFLFFAFIGGIGLILYLVALFIVPENPSQDEKERKHLEKDSSFLLAIVLILFGFLLLSRELGLFNYFSFWKIPWTVVWAVFLICIGLFLIIMSNKLSRNTMDTATGEKDVSSIFKQIYRSHDDRMIAGVCGGLAEYFKIDPSIVRLIWVFSSVASAGLGVLIYVILIFVFPEKPYESNFNRVDQEL